MFWIIYFAGFSDKVFSYFHHNIFVNKLRFWYSHLTRQVRNALDFDKTLLIDLILCNWYFFFKEIKDFLAASELVLVCIVKITFSSLRQKRKSIAPQQKSRHFVFIMRQYKCNFSLLWDVLWKFVGRLFQFLYISFW